MAGGFSIWSPIFGRALSDAALGYTEGLLQTPKAQDEIEEYKQRQALRPIELQHQQLALDELKARTAREQASADIRVTSHGIYQKNPATGMYEFMAASGQGKPLHGQARLEQARINLTNGVADTDDLTIIQLASERQNVFDPFTNSVVNKGDASSRPVTPGGSATSAPTSLALPGQAPPAQRTPATSPRPSGLVPTGSANPPGPDRVSYYANWFKGLPQDQREPYLRKWATGPDVQQAVDAVSGYQQAFGTLPSWIQTESASAPPVRPEPQTRIPGVPLGPTTGKTRQQLAEEAEQDRKERDAKARRTEAYGPITEDRSNAMIQLKAQGKVRDVPFAEMSLQEQALVVQEQERFKEAKLKRDTDQAALGQVRAAYGPMSDKRANAMVTLQAQKKIRDVLWEDLSRQEMALVAQEETRPEREKQAATEAHRRRTEGYAEERLRTAAMKQASPHFAELRAMEMSQKLTERIVPLLEKRTVGPGGMISWAVQALSSLPLVPSAYRQQATQQLNQQLEKQVPGISKAIDETRMQAQIAANVEDNEAPVRTFLLGPEISKLHTLVGILTYSHALAMKRGGGAGGSRGINKADLDRSEKLFSVDTWRANPDTVMGALQGLQGYIQAARPYVEEEIRALHIDPRTRQWTRPRETPPVQAPGPAKSLSEMSLEELQALRQQKLQGQ